MSDCPCRIQLKRTKGFKLPENSAVITRATKWGNPFCVTEKLKPGTKIGPLYVAVPTLADAIAAYQEMVNLPEWADMRALAKVELRGKHLACYCKPGEPCHGDILLKIANED